MTPRDKLASGFLLARRKAPYFDAALTGLVRVEVPGLGESTGIVGAQPTMGVSSSGVLFYEKEAIERWDEEEIAAVLVHEIGHLLRDHAGRCKGFGGHPVIFNIAGDAELNDDLKQGGWKLPGDGVLPKSLGAVDGLTAEEYYAYAEKKTVFVHGDGRLTTPGGEGVGSVCCGSGAGNKAPNEPDVEGRTEGEVFYIRHCVAEAIRRGPPGTVPGGWERWADKVLSPPKVRWQDKLARATRRAVASRPGGVTHTWRKLSRRQSACGYGPGRPVVPGLSQPTPRVAVCVDTSGSMSPTDLALALREASGVLRAVGSDVQFVVVDAAVHGCRSVRSVEEMQRLMKGGGGTDFRPAFEALKMSRDVPEVVIFATDGCGPAPEKPPAWCTTIWLLIGASSERPCNWGEFIEVRD